MAQQHTADQAPVLPYKHWWGLLGCAGLMGVILAVGPYSEGLVLEPDRGRHVVLLAVARADRHHAVVGLVAVQSALDRDVVSDFAWAQ